MQENDSLAYLSKYVMFFSEHQLKIVKVTRMCSYIWRKANLHGGVRHPR